MKNKVCIICCYMGKLPIYIDAFFLSCRYNKSFNWLIVTDDKNEYDIPENVTILNMTLKDVADLIHSKIGEWAELKSAYKLCDYKVAYGLIFEDYIREYTHWGYGDVDVMYGDLASFITDEMLDKYDKIYPLGHLSILKNNNECVNAFAIELHNTVSYKKVYTNKSSFFFDEVNGINEKMRQSGYSLYSGIDFCDISTIYSRLRTVTSSELGMLLKGSMLTEEKYPLNTKWQIFTWEDGKVYKYASYKKLSEKKEYSYIHFRRKLSLKYTHGSNHLLISKKSIEDFHKNIIARSNNKAYMDNFDLALFMLKRYVYKIRYNIFSFIAGTLYKIKPLRNIVRTIKGKSEE